MVIDAPGRALGRSAPDPLQNAGFAGLRRPWSAPCLASTRPAGRVTWKTRATRSRGGRPSIHGAGAVRASNNTAVFDGIRSVL